MRAGHGRAVIHSPATTCRSRLAGWGDALIATCLAPSCAVCRGWLPAPTRGAVCEACWATIELFTPPLCHVCGAPVQQSTRGDAAGCALCARAPLRDLDRAAALGLHDGTLRQIVHALKFGRRHGLAGRLGGLLRSAHADLLDGVDALVPVPLHRRRHRWRGFNQAHELARHLRRPIWPVLRRRRHGPPQASLDAHARAASVEGVFALAWRARWGVMRGRPSPRGCGPQRRPLEGCRLLLVDDVWTTGATLSACARVLRSAGAQHVSALVIARAVPSRLR